MNKNPVEKKVLEEISRRLGNEKGGISQFFRK